VNWLFFFLNAIYNLGLAIWIGGAFVLIALVKPSIFEKQSPHEAGATYGGLIRRFARVRVIAILMILIGAGAELALWGRNNLTPLLAVRWSAIVILAWGFIFEIRWAGRFVRWNVGIEPEAPADDLRRKFADYLRIRAEGLMKVSLIPALVALFS